LVKIRQNVVIVRGDIHGYIDYDQFCLLQRQARKAPLNTSSFIRVLSKLFTTMKSMGKTERSQQKC